MGNKDRKKRKNSSKRDNAHTSKSNKEAKSGSPEVVSGTSLDNSSLTNTEYLYSSPLLNTLNTLPVNMNMNGSPEW